MKSVRPWNLARLAGYERALPVDVVDDAEMTVARFEHDYVEQNRPLLIRGACRDWPALTKWTNVDYLRARCGAGTVSVRRRPAIESHFRDNPAHRSAYEADDALERVSFERFLVEATAPEADDLWVHSSLSVARSPLHALDGDVQELGFLRRAGWRSPRPHMYPRARAFFFRGGFTDWHPHPIDESFLCQVVGAKEVLLLPPDEESWSIVREVGHAHGRSYEADPARWPRWSTLVPHRVVIEPGDALFIPIFWWHAVEPVTDEFGISVATTFRSAVYRTFDLRYPCVRHTLRHLIPWPLLPVAYGAVAWSAVARTWWKLAAPSRAAVGPGTHAPSAR